MKNRNRSVVVLEIFLVFLAGIALPSCGNQEDSEVESSAKAAKEASRDMISKIDSLEKIVYVDTFDYQTKSTSELLRSYDEYTKKFPGDKKKTPEYYYKAAALCRAAKLPVKAIKYYDRILSDYPEFERAPEVAFLSAFTYDEDLNEKERAKEAYQEVIEKFPDDKWAEQATERLKTIDMSDEELIQSFMKKDSIANASKKGA